MKDTKEAQAKLTALEAALDEATERWRAAKVTVKHAKEDAKLAKKLRKRARKALIEAQESVQLADAEDKSAKKLSAGTRANQGQIADSPEPREKAKKRRKPVRRITESDSAEQPVPSNFSSSQENPDGSVEPETSTATSGTPE